MLMFETGALNTNSGASVERVSAAPHRRQSWWILLLLSAALLVPCFWQPRIEAGDLSSHIYNAVLARQIERGRLPGLFLAAQGTNVLFDQLLAFLLPRCGVAGTQRIAVSVAVMVFFWGAWTAVTAWSGNQPWAVAPALLIVTFGAIFNLGLFNYYLSTGLALAALAVVWNKMSPLRVASSIALLAIAWLGAPLSPLWVVAAFVYRSLRHVFEARGPQWVLPAAVLAALIAARVWIFTHFAIRWSPRQILYAFGPDQANLAGLPYKFVFLGFLLLSVAAVVLWIRRSGWNELLTNTIFPLYLFLAAAAFLLPNDLRVGVTWYGDLPQRFSLLAAPLLLALVNGTWLETAAMQSRAFVAIWAILALVFFAQLWADARRMNRVEAEVERAVRALSPDQRVVARPDGPVEIGNVLDRACIGHCYAWNNYEPATEVFRVRARPRNPFVMWSTTLSLAEQYRMTGLRQPLYQVVPCSALSGTICVQPVSQ